METQTQFFEELIRKRKAWVSSSQENDFDFDSILAGLYNDPSHFIYEILQNAEDAGANSVSFKLSEDRLEITHNGKDFDARDIDAVTGIGNSTKSNEPNAIGKFGVGFKSVFAITETPVIQSGRFHIEIRNFVVPSVIGSNAHCDTKIILPFNHSNRSAGEVFKLVSLKLQNLGLRSLLFLRNINEIQWEMPGHKGQYLKSSESVEEQMDVARTAIIAESNGEESFEEYLVFGKKFTIEEKELRVEVAFQISRDKDTGKKQIVPTSDAKLVVYFPTERNTYLKFLIQGPYKTTPNRENIPLINDTQNQRITEEIAKLVAESIPWIKKLGFLDVNFLTMLPIDESEGMFDPIYRAVFASVKEKLSSNEPLWPISNGGFARAETVLLARGQDLITLFSSEHISRLFSRPHWLDTSITYDRTRKLRDYLVQKIGIKEIDFGDIAPQINSTFMKSVSDEWLTTFYSQLLGQPALWRASQVPSRSGILRTKPIIRLENDQHIAPYSGNDKIQVYLPTATKSQYRTVKKAIIEQDSNALEFLKALGLVEPDIFAEIRQFVLPRYQVAEPHVTPEQYWDDLEKIMRAFNEKKSNQHKELLVGLASASVIYTVNCLDERKFLKPSQVYSNNDSLRTYFSTYEFAFFVDNELHQRCENVDELLVTLKINSIPQRVVFDSKLSSDEKAELRSKAHRMYDISEDHGTMDYNLEGLEELLDLPVALEQSINLWNLLVKSVENLSRTEAESFFEGVYKWKYYTIHSQTFDAAFCKLLKNTPWLFNKSGKVCRPQDINISDLDDHYIVHCSNLDVLIEKLGFRPEILQFLPEQEQRILAIARGRSPEEIEQALALMDAKSAKLVGENSQDQSLVSENSTTHGDPPQMTDFSADNVNSQNVHNSPSSSFSQNISNNGMRAPSESHQTRPRKVSYAEQKHTENTATSTVNNSNRDEIEQSAIKFVLEYERAQGRSTEDLNASTRNHPGWDIDSYNIVTVPSITGDRSSRQVVRRIEVKAKAGEWDDWGIGITSAQHRHATMEEFKNTYYLYVVEFSLHPGKQKLYIFHNPAQQIDEYRLDQNWKQFANESFPSEHFTK